MVFDVLAEGAVSSANAQAERLRRLAAHDRFMVAKKRARVKWARAAKADSFEEFVSSAVAAHELEADAMSVVADEVRAGNRRAEFWC